MSDNNPSIDEEGKRNTRNIRWLRKHMTSWLVIEKYTIIGNKDENEIVARNHT